VCERERRRVGNNRIFTVVRKRERERENKNERVRNTFWKSVPSDCVSDCSEYPIQLAERCSAIIQSSWNFINQFGFDSTNYRLRTKPKERK
jgi:hypothetical protein